MVIALFGTGALLLACAQHPFLTYPLSLFALRPWLRKPLRRAERAAPQGFSICMCAYNEERVIESKLANLLSLQDAYPDVEINIYVDAASDRTAELIEPYRGRVRLIVGSERKGKTYGMNQLVAQATKPILIFTDANVMIDPAAPGNILRYFADPTVGCVCSHLEYTNAGASVTAASGSLYWRLEEWTKRLESETGSAMGADGSLFAIRRELHSPPPDHIIDDMYVSFAILCAGYRIVQADDVNAYEESVTASHEEFSRKVRIACQAFNVHRLLWSRIRRQGPLDVYKYVSHKWMRWLTIYFLLGGALLIEAGLVLSGQLPLALGLLAAAGLGALIGHQAWLRPAAQLWDILVAFAGTGVGVLKSLRGAKFQTWTPAASIRQ